MRRKGSLFRSTKIGKWNGQQTFWGIFMGLTTERRRREKEKDVWAGNGERKRKMKKRRRQKWGMKWSGGVGEGGFALPGQCPASSLLCLCHWLVWFGLWVYGFYCLGWCGCFIALFSPLLFASDPRFAQQQMRKKMEKQIDEE
jgi:hypothetical protein